MRERTPIKFAGETKKAVLMTDLYEQYETMVQFYAAEIAELRARRAVLEEVLEDFGGEGGTVDYDEEAHRARVELGEVSYEIHYDAGGEVDEYTVRNPAGDHEAVTRLHYVFYASLFLAKLDAAAEEVEKKIRDLENDVLIRSMGRVGRVLGDDVYLTAAAVTGLDLRTDADVDPLGIYRKEARR